MEATLHSLRGSYEYFEHDADMGIMGRGPTMEEAFAQAARAMFDLMVDIHRVRPKKKVTIECRAEDQAELLVEWLNHLLAEADIHDMTFCHFLVEDLSESSLKGNAWGELFMPQRHHPKTEVKAATYAMLSVDRDEKQFIVRCVVDV